MAETTNAIIGAIKDLISSKEENYSDYYVGITNNPEERLFDEHNVSKNGVHGYWVAFDDEDAREVEKYCVDTLKTDGGTGGGNETSKYVYAYKKTSYTKEDA